MAYNRLQAKALCTPAEYELFLASLEDEPAGLTRTPLRARIRRAQTLRDKYTDLFRRQSLAARATIGTLRGVAGIANQRTAQKAALFEQTLKRFENQMIRLEVEDARTARARGAPKAPATDGSPGAGPGPRDLSPTVAARGKANPGRLRAISARQPPRREGR